MELFKLFGSIAVENAEANSAIDETGDKAESFSSKLKDGIATASEVGNCNRCRRNHRRCRIGKTGNFFRIYRRQH